MADDPAPPPPYTPGDNRVHPADIPGVVNAQEHHYHTEVIIVQQPTVRDAMLRHRRNKHGLTVQTYSSQQFQQQQQRQQQQQEPSPSPPQQQQQVQQQQERQPTPPPSQQQQVQQQQDFKFQHPFTCIVSGPTSCGKTYFVAKLLRHAHTKIQPPIQRIVWLYKRWQPLYDVIKATVFPEVEFIRGVPINLEKDDFIDIRYNNLIVLDDMASEAAKDPRVIDLFTEGRHHRNLSVIALNQNLYYSKDPTQRRNCQYLILFNNAVDKQPVATLARQMYPSNPKELLRHYDEAVIRPYGYLLLDLKPMTPERLRMRTDVLGINEPSVDRRSHFLESVPSVQTCSADRNAVDNTLLKNLIPDRNDVDNTREPNPDIMLFCEECGVVFGNTYDLQHHIKSRCPEKKAQKRSFPEDYQSMNKRMKYDESDDDSFENEDDEHEVYRDLAEKSIKNNEDEWQRKYEKYRKQGLTEGRAEAKANQKMREDDTRLLMEKCAMLLTYIFKLRGGHLYRKIESTIHKHLGRAIGLKRAIRLTLSQYKHHFEKYIDEVQNQESDTESSSDMSEDADDEDSDADPEKPDDAEQSGGKKPTAVQTVEKWVKSETERLRNAPRTSIIGRR